MFKTVDELPLEHSNVVLRVDFNVPLNPEGKILDETRIKSSLPTLRYLLAKNCKITILTHLGRPEGKQDSLSLRPIVPILERLLNFPVIFEESLESAINNFSNKKHPSITLIENLRFYKEEEDPSININFSEKLSYLGDFYINDAFACTHRDHSSITKIAQYFPDRKAAGFLLANETKELKKVLKPTHPFYLLLGGSKISTKIGVINSLLPKADALFIGGAMAFPFMQALGIKTGSAKVDKDQIEQAKTIIHQTHQTGKKLFLPCDWKCKKDPKSSDSFQIFNSQNGIPDDFQPLDIGCNTVKTWSEELKNAKTLFWNGPFGMYEISPFDQGTSLIADFIRHLSCQSVVGGGDTIAALEKLHILEGFSHLSTGGGASLEYLENGTLPGITALN